MSGWLSSHVEAPPAERACARSPSQLVVYPPSSCTPRSKAGGGGGGVCTIPWPHCQTGLLWTLKIRQYLVQKGFLCDCSGNNQLIMNCESNQRVGSLLPLTRPPPSLPPEAVQSALLSPSMEAGADGRGRGRRLYMYLLPPLSPSLFPRDHATFDVRARSQSGHDSLDI